MESRIAAAIRPKYGPVAILWSDEKPEGALQFGKGRWGCVMAAFGAVAERGGCAVFDTETFGCQGGGVGLGFGNQYDNFVGGMDGFCRFLSDGNAKSPEGQAAADAAAQFLRGEMREDFLHGERYVKNPELTRQFVHCLPMTTVPTRYVIFKPLKDITNGAQPQTVVFLANPDQVSALIVLANYGRGTNENVTVPFAAGCQSIGIYSYKESHSPHPRAVLGLNDLSARRHLRRLGKDLFTVALPYQLFLEMESNVEGSFLQRKTWASLQSDPPQS